MDFRSRLRSRLLVAAGLGTTVAPLVAGCGGNVETTNERSDAGSAGGSESASGASGASGSSGGLVVAAGSGGAAGGGANAGGSRNPPCEPWPSCISIRRPFLVGSELRSSNAAERQDWLLDLPPIEIPNRHTREILAASWLKDALEEHASVAAFARFTLLLLSVGAPPELIVASQRASLDEVQHARACFALARRYGSHALGPADLKVADSLTRVSLAELAALTVAEGCVGETLGALLAAEQLEKASDVAVMKILRRIARDEARHAELAWKFLAWALGKGGAAVERATVDAFERAAGELERMKVVDYGVDVALWHAHGRITCAEARELSRSGFEQVVSPCLAALPLQQGS